MSKKILTDLDFGGNKILNADIDGAVEYVTTSNTYAEVKALYDAGKKIILDCMNTTSSGTNHLYLPLIGYTPKDGGMLYFAGVGEMIVQSGELECAETGFVLTSSGWDGPGFVIVQPKLDFITEPSSNNKVATAADISDLDDVLVVDSTTTNAEILAAHNAGKVVVYMTEAGPDPRDPEYYNQGMCYPLVAVDENYAYFSGISSSQRIVLYKRFPDGSVSKSSINLNNYAPLASPAFTGTPTAPTPVSGDDSTKIATTEFVQDAVEGAGGVAKYTEVLDEDPANPAIGQIYSGYDDKVVFTENAPISFGTYTGVAFGNGKFVAINHDMFATYSTDGIHWVEDYSAGMHNAHNELIFANGKFVAISSSMESSTDGINWVNNWSMPSGTSYEGVAFGNDKFVAVGNGYTAYSTNGINWVENEPSSRINYSGVAFGNGKFVAVGLYTGYSTDGINWVDNGSMPFGITYNKVAFGNGKFVAVGSNGYTAYSTDGINWFGNEPLSSGAIYTSITFGYGKFVAVGSNGYTAYSIDGINWVENEPLSSGATYTSVTFGYGKFVAVSGNDHIAYSNINNTKLKYFNGIDWISYLDESDMPTVPTALSQLTDDSTHRLVTDQEKSAWNASDVVFITSVNTLDEVRMLFDAGKSVIFYDINNGRYAFPTVVTSNNYTFTTFYGYWDMLQSYNIAQYTVNSSGWTTTTISSDAASGSFRQSNWSGTTMAATMSVNFAYVNTNSSGVTTGTISFQTPSDTYNRTVEWTLAFKAGTNCSMTFTPPSGYTIKWKDGTPTFTSGKYYEISFRAIIANKLIIAYVSETDLS